MSRPRGGQIRLPSPDPRRFDARAVMPEGSLMPRVYLVGEAPGHQEAEAGRPFVGPAGAALRDMMREAGMRESKIRLANALPFRPIERSTRRGLRNRRPPEKELRDYGPIVLDDILSVRQSSSLRWGGPRHRYSVFRRRLIALASEYSAFRAYRSGLPIIQASCCGLAEEDRSYGEQQFAICVPIGNPLQPSYREASRRRSWRLPHLMASDSWRLSSSQV